MSFIVTDLVTFFRPRDDSYKTFRVDLDGGVFLAVCARPQVADRIRNSSAQTDSSKRNFVFETLREQGGVAVEINESTRQISATAFPAGGFAPPQNLLYLPIDSQPAWIHFGVQKPYAIGDHILVPVDMSAQENLVRLLEDLRYLPDDLERTILNHIRRPSLELRVSVLERQLMGAAAQAPQPGNGHGQPAPAPPRAKVFNGDVSGRWWHDKILVRNLAIACGIVAGVVAILALALYIARPQQDAGPNYTSEVADLAAAMRESENPAIRKIWTAYEPTYVRLNHLGSPDFADTVLKLEALRTAKGISEGGRSSTVAWLWCRASQDRPKPTPRNTILSKSCAEVEAASEAENIRHGFQNLIEFARKRPDPDYMAEARDLADAMKSSPHPEIRKIWTDYGLHSIEGSPLLNRNFAQAVLQLELIRNPDMHSARDPGQAFANEESRNKFDKGRGSTATAYVWCQISADKQRPTVGGITLPKDCPDITDPGDRAGIAESFKILITFANKRP